MDLRRLSLTRVNRLLQHLTVTGNRLALAASQPEAFSPEERRDIVAAWDEALADVREFDRNGGHINGSART